MNVINLLNLYKTWYKNIEITIENHTMRIIDKKVNLVYEIMKAKDITSTFSTLGSVRKALNKL